MTPHDIRFLIIGSAKCATTWLQSALMADPAVRMPLPELHFFSREHHRGTPWYLAQFGPGAQGRVIGEKSNSYLDTPPAAARIAAMLPQARLVAQLRNPVDRAYSDYCMLLRRGEVGKDLTRHLDPRVAADERFLAAGRYHRHLRRFLDLFPREQLLVTVYEDLRSDREAVLAAVREHVGLPREAPSPPGEARVKDRATPMLPLGMRRALRPFRALAAPVRGTAGFRALHGLLARPPVYPPLPEELRLRMFEHFAPDMERLSALTGRDLLAEWSAGGVRRAAE